MKINELFEEKETDFLIRTENGADWVETIVSAKDAQEAKSLFKKGLPRGFKIAWVKEKKAGDIDRSSEDVRRELRNNRGSL